MVSGNETNGTPVSASFSGNTYTGTFTLDSQPAQPLIVTQTSPGGFAGSSFTITAGSNSFDCEAVTTVTPSPQNFFGFVCAQAGGVSSSSASQQSAKPAAKQAAMKAAVQGAAHGTTRAQVEMTTEIISNRITSISGDIARSLGSSGQQSDAQHYYRGISAASADLKWGFWLDSSGSDLKDSSSIAKFNGYGLTEMAGVDYNLGNKWLFGFNAGYVRTNVNVPAITGSRFEDGEQFGPYVSYIASPHVSGDLLFNYSRLSNSATGLASFNSNRYAAAGNINVFYDVGGFALTGFMGYIYSVENPNSVAPGLIGGVPTSIHYGAVKVGGEAAYPIDNFEPYIPLTVEYETTNPRDGTGRGVVIIGAGVRYRFTDAIKGGIVVTSDEARSHSTNIVGAANLRISF